MSDAHSAATSAARPFSRVALLSIALSVAASALLGAAEIGAAAVLIPPEHGTDAPSNYYLMAAVGRAIATHMVIWTSTLLLFACLYFVCVGRRISAAPECALPAALLFFVGMTLLPAGLDMANRLRFEFVFPALVATPIVSVLAYFLLRLLRRGLGASGLTRIWQALGIAGAGAALLTFVPFVRSPLFVPGALRLVDAAPATPQATGSKPNVLLIVLDTVRADRMSVMGYEKPTTPFLEQWAKSALVFERVAGNGMWTIPTHAALFSRKTLREHGVGTTTMSLDEQFDTIAEVLTRNGYASGFFSCNPLVAMPIANLMQGFERRYVLRDFARRIRLSFDSLLETWGVTPLLPWQDIDFGAGMANQLIDDFLGEKPGQPKFVFLNLMECHAPFQAPKRYRQMFMTPQQVHRSFDLKRRVHGDMVSWLNLRGVMHGYDDFFAQEDREVIKRQYEAALRYLDDRVRETLAIFRKHGLLENTLVVITADHGEYLDTHGLWSHHVLTYQDLIHVPLMIQTPGQTVGQRSTALAQQTDVYPTILNFALGASTAPSTRDSRDLLEHAAAAGGERIGIAECAGPRIIEARVMLASRDPKIRHRASSQIAATDGRWKYIESSNGLRELFDLEADAGELNNLATTHGEQLRRFENYVKGWLASTPAYQPPPGANNPANLTPEQLQTLKSLGYVGGG